VFTDEQGETLEPPPEDALKKDLIDWILNNSDEYTRPQLARLTKDELWEIVNEIVGDDGDDESGNGLALLRSLELIVWTHNTSGPHRKETSEGFNGRLAGTSEAEDGRNVPVVRFWSRKTGREMKVR